MRHFILLTYISLIPMVHQAQTSDSTGCFGFALNSSMNGELFSPRIVPSVVYSKGGHQLELGVGMNPFDRVDQSLLSVEFNQKYFPNGMEDKFNLYLISRASYVHNQRNTYFQTTYNYLFLSAGYGIEIIPFKNAFIGTNVNLGVFTFDKKSEIPYKEFASQTFFDEIGSSLGFQFNIGYRFR